MPALGIWVPLLRECSEQAETVLIDEYLPEYHASERHATVIRAVPMEIYTALRTADFGNSLIMRGLLGLRAVPALFAEPHRMRRELRKQVSAASLTLNGFLEHGFALLAEDPGREIVIGLVGRFWRASGGLLATLGEPPTRHI